MPAYDSTCSNATSLQHEAFIVALKYRQPNQTIVNKIYKLLIGIIYLAGQGNSYAQESLSLSGKVRDQFGKPLPGATIQIKTAKKGTSSEADGFYKISGLLHGEAAIEVRMTGYATENITILLQNGKNNIHDFELREAKKDLNEVNIAGKSLNRTRIDEIKQSGFNVNVVDLNEFANMSTDINQVLKKGTGILIRENGGMGSNFTFQINGLAAKIYIDEVPMEQFGSSMTLNNIPANLIDRVEVYKGVVPAHLGGDALGGAVNIITKQRSRRFLDASHSYGSFNSNQTAITGGLRDPKTGLKFRASAFYNYSDNDYQMFSNTKYNVLLKAVKQDESTGDFRQYTIDKARRFYDRYKSAMGDVEVGYEKVKWADWFTLGLTYSANHKQNQLASTINSVYGGNWSTNNYFMPSVKYRKTNFIFDGLYANLYASYSRSKDNNRDTALYRYDWSGRWSNPGGTPIKEVNNRIVDDNYIGRASFNYNLDKAQLHNLSLTYNLTSTDRRSFDLMETNPLKIETTGLPSNLTKHILGFAWQAQWFDKKLISVASFKYYGMDTKVMTDQREFDINGLPASGQIETTRKFFGYPSGALALRYNITPELGIKASYEKGYNLPQTSYIFGDGRFVNANFSLKPEESNNLNYGAYYNHIFGDQYIKMDASMFYRKSKNYISSVVLDDNIHSQSQNFPGIKLNGFEAEAKYGYKDIFSLAVNGSYDRARDDYKYTDATQSQISLTYKEQLPNRPWVYGNADVMLAKRDLFGKNTRIQFNYIYQYVHWFYLTWEKLGEAGSLNFVPTQTIHNAVVTYSWRQDRYNLSFEARNITNELAYDNYRLQKPGRAFYLKFRVSIM